MSFTLDDEVLDQLHIPDTFTLDLSSIPILDAGNLEQLYLELSQQPIVLAESTSLGQMVQFDNPHDNTETLYGFEVVENTTGKTTQVALCGRTQSQTLPHHLDQTLPPDHLDQMNGQPPEEATVPTTSKRVKYEENQTCLLCQAVIKNRMERHLKRAHKDIDKKDLEFLGDFYRTRGSPKSMAIWDCKKCYKRFSDKTGHMKRYKCEPEDLLLVKNFTSKNSLPTQLRVRLRDNIITRVEDVDVAKRFVERQRTLATNAGNAEKTLKGIERPGMLSMLGLLFGSTACLSQPTELLKTVQAYKARNNLEPQTVINYMSTFKKFVYNVNLHENYEFCIDKMKTAINEITASYNPAAERNYRKVAKTLLHLVPTQDQVQERVREVCFENVSDFLPIKLFVSFQRFIIKNSKEIICIFIYSRIFIYSYLGDTCS